MVHNSKVFLLNLEPEVLRNVIFFNRLCHLVNNQLWRHNENQRKHPDHFPDPILLIICSFHSFTHVTNAN